MSVLNWLVAFTFIFKSFDNSSLTNGLLALIAIIFAHLGTNLFDDFVDDFTNTPKQECKTKYLSEGFTTIKSVLIASLFCFIIALSIGIFFFLKFGLIILYLTLITGLIIVSYPKLNNFALGEAAVSLCFGFLMFAGINVVMTGDVNINTLLISIPVSLLTSAVVFCHSIMDYEFDKKSNKNTLCVLFGFNNALKLLLVFYLSTIILTIILTIKNIIPQIMSMSVICIPYSIKLYKNLKIYNPEINNEFMKNFLMSRNISLFYNLLLIASLVFFG